MLIPIESQLVAENLVFTYCLSTLLRGSQQKQKCLMDSIDFKRSRRYEIFEAEASSPKAYSVELNFAYPKRPASTLRYNGQQ